MKNIIFVVGFILIAGSAYCGGSGEMILVNDQEILLDNIAAINISYTSDDIILLKSSTDTLFIKEYMNKNNSDYYANINSFENKLSINGGNRPNFSGGIRTIFSHEINNLRTRIEIYIPVPLIQEISIKITSGRIVANNDFRCNHIALQAKSGSIRLGIIEGDLSIETTSGSIVGEMINGNISAKTTSGRIRFNEITGRIDAETTSGGINCSVNEMVGNISLRATSGSVKLMIPRNSSFNFFARTSSGRLSTSFSDKLFIPVAERSVTQGTIGEGSPDINVNIITSSGSIDIKWKN
jgi:lia operon protein LiaG